MQTLSRYITLRNLLLEKILSGKYSAGDRFLSQNEIIKKYSLSFSTVSRALDELVREGYLLRETGRGTFIKSLTPGLSTSNPDPKNMFIFVPMTGICGGLVEATQLYKHLNSKRPDNVAIHMVPHSLGSEDLDYFLFNRDEIHLAVFLDPVDEQKPFREMLSKQCPVLTIATDDKTQGIGNLHIDYAGPTADAVAYLIALGHTNIALLCQGKMAHGTSNCVAAYRSALDAASIPFQDTLVKYAPNEATSLPQYLGGWTQMGKGVTAIVILIPNYTEVLMESLTSAGKKIPEDISLISLETNNYTSPTHPAVTCIEISTETIAEKLLDLLSTVTPPDVIHETLKARLIVRQSTGPRRLQSAF